MVWVSRTAIPLFPHKRTFAGKITGYYIKNLTILKGRAFGKYLDHEGGALMNGICALIRRDQIGRAHV